jgi:uracil-DNA glycosylase
VFDPGLFRFPFGQPLLPCQPVADGPRRVLVLGAYPSALHVAWTPPATAGRGGIKALPVDNEPEPFWTGADEAARIDAWRRTTQTDPVAHGVVRPAGRRNNGSSGACLDREYLAPLGLGRSDCWITDCLDTYRMSSGVEQALTEQFIPLTRAAGLPVPLLPTHPDEPTIVSEALGRHAGRLQAELAQATPEVILTLGNAALRVLREILPAHEMPDRLKPVGYGLPTTVRVGTRTIKWHALAHPGALSKLRAWQHAHYQWRQTVQV